MCKNQKTRIYWSNNGSIYIDYILVWDEIIARNFILNPFRKLYLSLIKTNLSVQAVQLINYSMHTSEHQTLYPQS